MKHSFFGTLVFCRKSPLVICSILLFIAGFLSCQKEISIELSKVGRTDWEFKQGDSSFSGHMDTAYLDHSLVANSLVLMGTATDGRSIFLGIAGVDTKQSATYKTPQVLFAYTNNGTILYQSNPSSTKDFTVNIEQVDSLMIRGTFSGSIKNSTGTDLLIKEGKFLGRFFVPKPVPPAVRDSGRVAFWSKSTCSGGDIRIKINNTTQHITLFTAAAPADCTTPGMARFSLPVGSYKYTSYCGTDSLTGTVSISKGQCVKKEII